MGLDWSHGYVCSGLEGLYVMVKLKYVYSISEVDVTAYDGGFFKRGLGSFSSYLVTRAKKLIK